MQVYRMIFPKERHLILPCARAATPGKQPLVNGGSPAVGSGWSVPPGHARYLHYPYSRVRRRRR